MNFPSITQVPLAFSQSDQIIDSKASTSPTEKMYRSMHHANYLSHDGWLTNNIYFVHAWCALFVDHSSCDERQHGASHVTMYHGGSVLQQRNAGSFPPYLIAYFPARISQPPIIGHFFGGAHACTLFVDQSRFLDSKAAGWNSLEQRKRACASFGTFQKESE